MICLRLFGGKRHWLTCEMMNIRFSATTHVGHRRKINEDSVLALPDQKIWVVSDGMGGHAGGDFASQTVVDSVAMMDPNLPPEHLAPSLREAISRAHDAIYTESKARNATIGATVVTFMMSNQHFAAFWACLLYTSPSPRDQRGSRMPSSA